MGGNAHTPCPLLLRLGELARQVFELSLPVLVPRLPCRIHRRHVESSSSTRFTRIGAAPFNKSNKCRRSASKLAYFFIRSIRLPSNASIRFFIFIVSFIKSSLPISGPALLLPVVDMVCRVYSQQRCVFFRLLTQVTIKPKTKLRKQWPSYEPFLRTSRLIGRAQPDHLLQRPKLRVNFINISMIFSVL